MKLVFLLLLIPVFTFAKAPAKSKAKPHAVKKQAAVKINSGKQICQMIEKLIKGGVPHQTDIELSVGKKLVTEGKVGVINQGTGTFHIGNLYFRAYATVKGEQNYEEKCLTINFPDLDGDGIKDLEVKTTINKLGAAPNPLSDTAQVYERTFLYRPEQKSYDPASGSPNPFVELLIR